MSEKQKPNLNTNPISLNIDNTDFDLNSIFNFQHNYDLLRRLIEALAKMQKQSEKKISTLEIIVNNKNKEIENIKKGMLSLGCKVESLHSSQIDLPDIFKEENLLTDENQSIIKKNNFSNQIIPISRYKNLEDIDNGKDDHSINDLQVDESKISKKSSMILNNTVQKDIETSDMLNKIHRRVTKIEKEILEFDKLDRGFNEFKVKSLKTENEVTQNMLNIKEIKLKLESTVEKIGPWEENIEKLNVKVMDFNVYDLFKGNNSDGNGDGGIIDSSMILIQNLDNKVNTKISLMDKKIKLFEEENHKIKNDISSMKFSQDGLTRNLNNYKEEMEKMNKTINEHYTENKNNLTNLENLEGDNNNKLRQMLDENVRELRELINNGELIKLSENHFNTELSKNLNLQVNTDSFNNQVNNNNNQINTNNTKTEKGLSESDLKLIRDTSKRLLDLEKNYRVFSSNLNSDLIKSEFSRITDLLNAKANNNEIHELKESINQTNYGLTYAKETLNQLLEDRKILNDVNWIRKKVETLTSSMLNMKNGDEPNSAMIKTLPVDTSKYLEQNIFTEFQKGYNRELDGLRKDTDEIKRIMDDVFIALKPKASDKDLKNLEEYLITKLEEMRLNSIKKYSDKTETQKNLKYLDTQVKHIIDVYIKKMEKGDNWLIAKKPGNGFACASCETYIGDLNDKTGDYVPWNKYPIRDPNEKAYRIGNGFSRMLQMLNLDVKKSNDGHNPTANQFAENVNNGEGSDDDYGKSHSIYTKKELVLPNVIHAHNLNKDAINMSADNIKEENEYEATYKPKCENI